MTNRPKLLDFAGIASAIIEDCASSYPHDRLWLARDSKRVRHGFVEHGLAFFTLMLPAFSDLLLEGLETGRLPKPEGLPFGDTRWNWSPIPRLFSSIWLRIFDENGLLNEDPDPTAIFMLMSLTGLGKKVVVECTPQNTGKVIDEYFEIEQALPPSAEIWDGLDFVRRRSDCGDLLDYRSHRRADLFNAPKQSEDWGLLLALEDSQRFADLIVAALGPFDPEFIVGKHGPGVVSDLDKDKVPKWTFPIWSERLDSLFPFDYHGVLNSGMISVPDEGILPNRGVDEQPHSRALFYQEGASRLAGVPKSAKGPRLIAAEPAAFQFIQQGLAQRLRRCVHDSLLGLSVDFFSQLPSQRDCLESSRSQSRATIDLSSASDRLSTGVVQRIFRGNIPLLNMLIACRTRFLSQDLTRQHPQLIKLRKYASQGSALTFPIQSIVFAILAVGTGKSLEPKKSWRALCRSVRVFGDDIIVPVHWVKRLVDLLTSLGLKVNMSKSFWNGKFRESCGEYAYDGHSVAPFRVRSPSFDAKASSVRAHIDTVNQAFIKGLWKTSVWLEKTSGRKQFNFSIDRRVSPFGYYTNSKGVDPRVKRRWNRHYQDWEASIPVFLSRDQKRYSLDDAVAWGHLIGKVYPDRSNVMPFLKDPKRGGRALKGRSLVLTFGELKGATGDVAVVRNVRVPWREIATAEEGI